jgi:hypothetical protein
VYHLILFLEFLLEFSNLLGLLHLVVDKHLHHDRTGYLLALLLLLHIDASSLLAFLRLLFFQLNLTDLSLLYAFQVLLLLCHFILFILLNDTPNGFRVFFSLYSLLLHPSVFLLFKL